MIRSTSFRSAVQYRGGELALAISPSQALANGRAFIFGATASAIFLMVMGSPALAITNIATVVCGWAPTIGTVGTALAFIVFLAGLAMIAVGSKQGFGRTIWAILGAVALFAGVQLFGALTGGACGQASG